MGLWAWEGTGGHPPAVRDGTLFPASAWEETCLSGSSAWPFTACAVARPGCPPLGCSANVLVPYHSFRRVETLERLANSLATKSCSL